MMIKTKLTCAFLIGLSIVSRAQNTSQIVIYPEYEARDNSKPIQYLGEYDSIHLMIFKYHESGNTSLVLLNSNFIPVKEQVLIVVPTGFPQKQLIYAKKIDNRIVLVQREVDKLGTSQSIIKKWLDIETLLISESELVTRTSFDNADSRLFY